MRDDVALQLWNENTAWVTPFANPQKSPHQGLSPKKSHRKIPNKKKSPERKFQPPKRASYIPVTIIPECFPWGSTGFAVCPEHIARSHRLHKHTSRNLEITLLSSALIPTTFSKSQKKGLSNSDLGRAYSRSRKKWKKRRPVPSANINECDWVRTKDTTVTARKKVNSSTANFTK